MGKNWATLDLRKTDGVPEDGRLAALKVVGKDAFAIVRYFTGAIERDARSSIGKAWFRDGSGGTYDLANLNKKHDVWWCYLPPFDGDYK